MGRLWEALVLKMRDGERKTTGLKISQGSGGHLMGGEGQQRMDFGAPPRLGPLLAQFCQFCCDTWGRLLTLSVPLCKTGSGGPLGQRVV